MFRLLHGRRRYPALGGAALLLIPLLQAGCGSDSGSESGANEGVWNADIRFSVNAEPEQYASVMTFRFDQGPSGWECLVSGFTASVCQLEGDPASYQVKASTSTEYTTYIRSVTYEYSDFQVKDDNTLLAKYLGTLVRTYKDGRPTTTVTYEGTASLVRVERYDEAESKGLRLLGEYGDFDGAAARGAIAHEEEEPAGKGASNTRATANVRVKGDYAYLARFGDGLRVLNIADPANIFEVAAVSADSVGAYYFNDIKLFSAGDGDYAALSDSRIGLVVFDVTEPSAPTLVSTFFPGLAESDDVLNNHTVFMVGTTAYLGNYGGSHALDPDNDGYSGGLLIVDLSDPANPRELGRWLASSLGGYFVHDLYVEDGIAYLACWDLGLVMIDVSDPANPTVLGNFQYDRMTSHSVWVTTVNGRRIAAHGDEDFTSHLRLIDVTDPAQPALVSEFQLRPEVSIHNVMASGNEVVAAWYQDGVRVVDISDPGAPTLTAWYNTWGGHDDPSTGRSFYEGGIGVDVQGERIYLADISRGLLVLERE